MVAASSCAGEGEGSLVVVLVADRGDSSRGQVQRREAAMARPWPGSADARRRGGAGPGRVQRVQQLLLLPAAEVEVRSRVGKKGRHG